MRYILRPILVLFIAVPCYALKAQEYNAWMCCCYWEGRREVDTCFMSPDPKDGEYCEFPFYSSLDGWVMLDGVVGCRANLSWRIERALALPDMPSPIGGGSPYPPNELPGR